MRVLHWHAVIFVSMLLYNDLQKDNMVASKIEVGGEVVY